MYKFAVRSTIRRNVKALTSGDLAPLLAGYADNATFVFPGTSSWGGEYRGKAAIKVFLERFIAAGLEGEVHEILVNGPPWRTTIAVLFTDRATDESGATVYENRAILFARARWGRIVYQEDFENTHKVEAFEGFLLKRASDLSGL